MRMCMHMPKPEYMCVHVPCLCAGGLPIGAVLVSQKVADAMKPGDHGSTFAGSPLVTRVAATTFDIIRQPEFLEAVRNNGERLMQVCQCDVKRCVRGPGPACCWLQARRARSQWHHKEV